MSFIVKTSMLGMFCLGLAIVGQADLAQADACMPVKKTKYKPKKDEPLVEPVKEIIEVYQLCPGATVYLNRRNSFFTDTERAKLVKANIVAVNPNDNSVSVHENGGYGNTILKVDEIFVTDFTANKEIKINQVAKVDRPHTRIKSTQVYAKILGYNFIKNQVALKVDNDQEMYIYEMHELASKSVCVLGVCPGENVMIQGDTYGNRSSWVKAVVKEVDDKNNMAKVEYQGTGFLMGRTLKDLKISQIATTKNCVQKICVGDEVLSPSMSNAGSTQKAQVVAVNQFSGQVILNVAGYYGSFSFSYADLFITKECIDYNKIYREENSAILSFPPMRIKLGAN